MSSPAGHQPFWRRDVPLPPAPRFRTALATLAGLWGFAFLDPVLGVVGPSAAFFNSHGAYGWEVFVWLGVISALPPIVFALAVSVIASWRERAGSGALTISAAVLSALIVVPRVDDALPLLGALFLVTMAIWSAGFGLAYASWSVLRRFVAATWFSPVVFGFLFLVTSPASGLVTAVGEPEFPPVTEAHDLIMIVLDEFPLAALLDAHQEIDAVRFPGFSKLAGAATWYRDATATSVRTQSAIPSLLTGRNPTGALKPPPAKTLSRSIFSMLAREADLHTAEPVARLCDFAGCNQVNDREIARLYRDTGLVSLREWMPESAATKLAFMEAGWAFVEGDEAGQMASLREVVEGVSRPRARSAVWYAHTLLPHQPWTWLPDGYRYPGGFEQLPGGEPRKGLGYWHSDPPVVDLMRQRLVLQIQAVDQVLGDLADALSNGRISAETMVVVTADHGLSFEPGRHARGLDLGPEQYAEIARVPLFVRYPTQSRGVVDDRPAALIDVAPTIADVMNVRLPASWTFDGRSLLASPRHGSRLIFDDSGPIALPDEIDMSRAVAQYTRLGLGSPDSSGAFTLGALGPMVGRSWASLNLSGDEVRATLLDGDSFTAVKLESGAPALVQALVPAQMSGGFAAVALNGTVAGSGVVYEDNGASRVAAMVDPRFFRAGLNEVRIAIGSDPAHQLVPLDLRR